MKEGENVNWVTTLQEAIDYIEANINENLNSERIAKKVHISSYYFQRMFTLLCSCTVGEYIRNRRLTLAAMALIENDETILDIGLRYGYESNESFTRAFQRYHGITPSMVKKRKIIPNPFYPISIKSHLVGGKEMITNFSKRGYIVKETGSVYYTKDMDKTLEWFVNILGWYGQIEARTSENTGMYGCVNNIPMEIEALNITPFTGIHLFMGEPIETMVGFMKVEGIDKLYAHVKKNGWHQITEIQNEPWGGKTCDVTTIDGSILRFFEITGG